MNKITEALKTAIEAIEYQESLDPDKSSTTEWNHSWKELSKALIMCKEALAEAKVQESLNLKCKSVQKRLATQWGYVKAEAEKQKWQSLSDDEIQNELKNMWDKGLIPSYSIVEFARAIEQALKEKND